MRKYITIGFPVDVKKAPEVLRNIDVKPSEQIDFIKGLPEQNDKFKLVQQFELKQVRSRKFTLPEKTTGKK